MECNKEEAMRAVQMAEKKMENKDFVSARKIALKAQVLYPDLENISQMITVCDVHCSAENKIYGNDKDWYGILKVDSMADEVSIKKQYRKFALILHPDKNKFAGAADAFKLIGEAQRVLLDVEKRKLHDITRTNYGRSTLRVPHQASGRSNMRNPPWVHNNFMSNLNQQTQPPLQESNKSGFHNNRPTFWTACPFCSVRYQFYTDVLNKLLFCQGCKKSFTGYEMNSQGATFGTNWSRPAPQNVGQNQGPSRTGAKSPFKNFVVGEGSIPDAKFVGVKINKKRQSKEPKSYGKANGKRRKQVVESSESSSSESSADSEEEDAGAAEESSESCGSGSSTDPEEVVVIKEGSKFPSGQNIGGFDERYPRRSTRSKRNVSYSENLSDDDEVMNSSKMAKFNGSFQDSSAKNKPPDLDVDMEEEDDKEVKPKSRSLSDDNSQNGGKETGKETVTEDDEKTFDNTFVYSSKASPNAATEPQTYEYPDPDFSDFDKDRKEDCFAVEQIWAAYDPPDALPRFYARIRKVFSPRFKLRITWLEPFPTEEDEIKWVIADLPVSCGNFRYGKSEMTEDLPMFSHMVCWGKGSGRDSFKIYPMKGETWALFKNWDINWASDPDKKRDYEYDFVEVLSNYDDGVGIRVAYLSKVKGFACLFCRTSEKGEDLILIPAKDIFRFSHRVPSFKMTGEERADVPKGSFELDPAALPTNLAIPEIVKPEYGRVHPNGGSSRGK
ncbi:hypothetical protein LguiA_031156 [Lonicera macranthoides]